MLKCFSRHDLVFSINRLILSPCRYRQDNRILPSPLHLFHFLMICGNVRIYRVFRYFKLRRPCIKYNDIMIKKYIFIFGNGLKLQNLTILDINWGEGSGPYEHPLSQIQHWYCDVRLKKINKSFFSYQTISYYHVFRTFQKALLGLCYTFENSTRITISRL